ncbi:MAG: G8 domain-containing protein [Lysobacterales bacterium]
MIRNKSQSCGRFLAPCLMVLVSSFAVTAAGSSLVVERLHVIPALAAPTEVRHTHTASLPNQALDDGLKGAADSHLDLHPSASAGDPANLMSHEHMAAMNLLVLDEATHISQRSGEWSDPTLWSSGSVPGAGAIVLVNSGHQVAYQQSSDVALDLVHVDGALVFAPAAQSRLVVDTMVASPGSLVSIGTMAEPVTGTVEILIADPGPDHSFSARGDDLEIGLGMVLHGEVSIHGQAKAPYLPVAGVAADGRKILAAGSSSLTLAPMDFDDWSLGLETWRIGDDIVVMGTERGEYQDELRRITAISGNEVFFEPPLEFSHSTPAFQTNNVSTINELSIFVANLTRRISIRSQYQGFEQVERRGHFMVMHSPGADIRFARFSNLGRTDKRIPTNQAVEGQITTRDIEEARREARALADSHPYDRGNPEGRYPLHFHRLGTGIGRQPFVAIGNAVDGSPGWGITHHDSYGAVNWNVVYDVVGAGIVSEDGNETGEWIGNFVTQIPGAPDRRQLTQQTVQETGDSGFAGVAFESQSRVITQRRNIAANARFGWSFLGISTSLGHAKALGRNSSSADFVDQPYNRNPGIITSYGPDIRQIQYNHKPQLLFGPMTAQFMQFSENQMIAISESGVTSWHRKGPPLDTFELLNQIDRAVAWRVDEVFNFVNYAGGYHVANSLFVDVGTVVNVQEKSTKNHIVNSHIEDASRVFFLNSPKTLNDQGVYLGNIELNVDSGVDGLQVPRDEPNAPAVSYQPGTVVWFDYPYPRVGQTSELVAVPFPSVQFSAQALKVGPSEALELQGVVFDSLGTREFSWQRWFFDRGDDGIYDTADDDIRVPGGHGHRAGRPGILGQGSAFPAAEFMQWTEGTLEWTEMLALYGAIRRNGRWVMPIPIWLNDLSKGDPYPYLVDFEIDGANEQDLLDAELTTYPTVDSTGVSFGNPNFLANGTPARTRTYYVKAWRVPIPQTATSLLFRDGFE